MVFLENTPHVAVKNPRIQELRRMAVPWTLLYKITFGDEC